MSSTEIMLREYPVSIPANTTVIVNVVPAFQLFVESLTGDVDVTLGVVESSAQVGYFPLKEKYSYASATEFNSVSLTNNGGSTASLTFSISRGKIEDNSTSITNAINIDGADNIDEVADVSLAATTAGKIADADSTRRSILISNSSSNAAAFRIGSSTVSNTRGMLLEPGTTVELTSQAEIHAYNTHSSAQSLNMTTLSN